MAVDRRRAFDAGRDPHLDDRRPVRGQQAGGLGDDLRELDRLEPALFHAERRVILQDLLDMAVLLGDDAEIFGEALSALEHGLQDRKSTRLNSSHVKISYAVFCLKKKTKSKSQYRSQQKKTSTRRRVP